MSKSSFDLILAILAAAARSSRRATRKLFDRCHAVNSDSGPSRLFNFAGSAVLFCMNSCTFHTAVLFCMNSCTLISCVHGCVHHGCTFCMNSCSCLCSCSCLSTASCSRLCSCSCLSSCVMAVSISQVEERVQRRSTPSQSNTCVAIAFETVVDAVAAVFGVVIFVNSGQRAIGLSSLDRA